MTYSGVSDGTHLWDGPNIDEPCGSIGNMIHRVTYNSYTGCWHIDHGGTCGFSPTDGPGYVVSTHPLLITWEAADPCFCGGPVSAALTRCSWLNCESCPDTSLPETLIATVTGATGSCTGVNGFTFSLTRGGSSGSYYWNGGFFANETFNYMTISCEGGAWSCSFATSPTGCIGAGGGVMDGTCDPLTMSIVVKACMFCSSAAPGETLTILVTE